jgi:hypothetical protein
MSDVTTSADDKAQSAAREHETQLDAMRATIARLTREVARLTGEADAYRKDVAVMVSQLRADVERLTKERDLARSSERILRENMEDGALRTQRELREALERQEALRVERDDAAQVVSDLRALVLQKSKAVAQICDALGDMPDRTPEGAVRVIASMRSSLTQEREGRFATLERAEKAERERVATMAAARESVDAINRTMCEALAARDAQEGDRIAAWAERSEDVVCARCWYPAPARWPAPAEALCNACNDEREESGR